MEIIKKEKKILLTLLPFWTPLMPPQGICRIKSFLNKHGYNVKTIDANLESEFKLLYDKYFNILRNCIPQDKRGNFYNIGNDVCREHMMAHINYTNEKEYILLIKILVNKVFYHSIDELIIDKLNQVLNEYYNKLEKYILELIDREQPDIFGISVYRDTLPSTVFAFRLVRKKYPKIRNIMGGGIFTIQLTIGSPNLEYFLKQTINYIDKVFIGNGEQLLLEYFQGNLSENKRLYTNDDLSDTKLDISKIDLPDYSDFNYNNYHYLAAQGSTSCPNQCSFCNVAAFYGKYKSKDPNQTAKDMQTLYLKHKIQLFFMLDALLNPIITNLSMEILQTELPLYWDGYFRIDEEACDFDKVLLWRKGGFYRARIGVETGSQKILDIMQKNISTETTRQNIKNLANAGIKTTAYIVIGHPEETEEDFQQTLDLMEELKSFIWEAECNPFTYFYSGQAGGWANKRFLLYPESATEMLMYKTWYVDCEPSREVMYERVNRFVQHCNKIGISTPWNLYDVNKSDERWKKLHKNSVPSLLELSDREHSFYEKNQVEKLEYINKSLIDNGNFDF